MADKKETSVTAKYRVLRNKDVPKKTPLILDLASDVELLFLNIHGKTVEYERVDETVVIRNVPRSFEMETKNLINTQDNTTGEGLYQAHDMLLIQTPRLKSRGVFLFRIPFHRYTFDISRHL